MNIGKQWRAAAMALGLGLSFLLTGCGGGDDDKDDGDAPARLRGNSYDLTEDGTGAFTAVTFRAGNAYTFLHADGAIEQGNYDADRHGDDNITVTLFASTGGQQVYGFDFSSRGSGRYTLRLEAEPTRTGSFTTRGDPLPAAPDDDPNNPNNPNNPDPNAGYNGFAPISIAGRTMLGTRTFTSTGPTGQTHVYTFSNSTFHDSDPPEESDGRYEYNASNSSATLTLNYTGPSAFRDDRHQLTLTFTERDRGTFESTYTRGDGTMIVINGNFQFQPR